MTSERKGWMKANGKTAWAGTVSLVLVCLAFALGAAGCSAGKAKASADEGSQTSTTSETTAKPIEWTIESDCSPCHKSESATDSKCLAATHAAANVACASCHADVNGLTSAHEGVTANDVKATVAMTKTTVSSDTCKSCHDVAAVAAKAAGSTALTDANGTVVNPHELPANSDHATLECTSCHKAHSTTAVATTAMRACTSCHHANVFECGTCHSAK
ncbi:MAG: cytochrome c3 family protein [Coriobacteriia bacterium]